jgi:hypothetical protein
MKLPVRKVLPFLVAFALLSAVPHRRVEAWGPAGHRIVALVAMKHLTDEARAQVQTLLGDETLADVANWADDVRDDRPNTAKWHFVNLPKTAATFDRSRDCRAGGPDDPGCAVTAIEMARDILSGARAGDKAEALKFLVHFVGDLHQPLHVSYKADKGGNNIDVTFFGKKSNLHKVWDSGIIRQADLSDEEFAAELEAVLWEGNDEQEVKENIERLQGGSVDSWANESYALAKSNAYDNVLRNGKARLSTTYYEGVLKGARKPNWQVVDEQLTKGGLRLAKLINDSLR